MSCKLVFMGLLLCTIFAAMASAVGSALESAGVDRR